MNWNNVRITIFKELRGIIRDKKSLHKILLFPLIIPTVILLFGFLFESMDNSNYKIGVNYEPTTEEQAILKEMENINLVTYQTEKELKEKYDSKDIDAYIIKKDNLYTIYSNSTVNSGEMINTYLQTYLQAYSEVLAKNYVVSQGLDPDKVFNNVYVELKSTVKMNNTESEEEDDNSSILTVILSLVVTYVLMLEVMTCVVVAADATSGEKERGTLETILTFPIKSTELVAGKYLATAILGCSIGIVSYVLTIPSIIIGRSMFNIFKEITYNINILSTLLVLLIIVISALLSAGVCIALSGKAKTYKEAQSSLQFVSLLPMIPYFINVMEIDSSIVSFIPIANCGMAMNAITMNNIDFNSLLIIIISSIVYIVLIILFISKQYKSEKTLFS